MNNYGNEKDDYGNEELAFDSHLRGKREERASDNRTGAGEVPRRRSGSFGAGRLTCDSERAARVAALSIGGKGV